MNLVLISSSVEGASDPGIAPYIAAGIAAAVFLIAALVVRSFRDVAQRRPEYESAAGSEQH